MTDNEIIKIFERLCKVAAAPQVLNAKTVRKLGVLSKATLDLINRQKRRIHWLEIELKAMRGAANAFKADNERLKKLLEEAETNEKEAAKRFYKAGIKDFANTFTEQFVLLLALNCEQADLARKCASKLTEKMVGDNK